jgi:hypothetical protein
MELPKEGTRDFMLLTPLSFKVSALFLLGLFFLAAGYGARL